MVSSWCSEFGGEWLLLYVEGLSSLVLFGGLNRQMSDSQEAFFPLFGNKGLQGLNTEDPSIFLSVDSIFLAIGC